LNQIEETYESFHLNPEQSNSLIKQFRERIDQFDNFQFNLKFNLHTTNFDSESIENEIKYLQEELNEFYLFLQNPKSNS
jgi:hypothetical protein